MNKMEIFKLSICEKDKLDKLIRRQRNVVEDLKRDSFEAWEKNAKSYWILSDSLQYHSGKLSELLKVEMFYRPLITGFIKGFTLGAFLSLLIVFILKITRII